MEGFTLQVSQFNMKKLPEDKREFIEDKMLLDEHLKFRHKKLQEHENQLNKQEYITVKTANGTKEVKIDNRRITHLGNMIRIISNKENCIDIFKN